jgi:hypothetical protein
MLIGDLALVSAALFTGAAFYINLAEQPARLILDDRSLLAQWKPAYKRGYIMQATLGDHRLCVGSRPVVAERDPGFHSGAVLMLANWPWTLFGIMPTNRILMATELQSAGSASRAAGKTGPLHAVRTGLAAAATLSFLWALAWQLRAGGLMARPSASRDRRPRSRRIWSGSLRLISLPPKTSVRLSSTNKRGWY